jgi:DNA-binding MarR family transcriptional regulator
MSETSAPSAKAAQSVRDTCVCLHLQRAARVIGRRYDEALRPVALTNEQFSLLVSLARSEPPSIGQLATEMSLDRTTLTASLKPLERRGLLRIGVSPDDRRGRLLTLSKAGSALLAEALPLWRLAQASILKEADSVDLGPLRADLRALTR